MSDQLAASWAMLVIALLLALLVLLHRPAMPTNERPLPTRSIPITPLVPAGPNPRRQ